MSDRAGGAAIALNRSEEPDTKAVRQQLLELIDRDLARSGVSVADPKPNAPVGMVLPNLIPVTGNVLIPLGHVLSRLGVGLRLLKPGL